MKCNIDQFMEVWNLYSVLFPSPHHFLFYWPTRAVFMAQTELTHIAPCLTRILSLCGGITVPKREFNYLRRGICKFFRAVSSWAVWKLFPQWVIPAVESKWHFLREFLTVRRLFPNIISYIYLYNSSSTSLINSFTLLPVSKCFYAI